MRRCSRILMACVAIFSGITLCFKMNSRIAPDICAFASSAKRHRGQNHFRSRWMVSYTEATHPDGLPTRSIACERRSADDDPVSLVFIEGLAHS